MKNKPASPTSAESELRRAYDQVIECCMIARGEPTPATGATPHPGVNLNELLDSYKRAFNMHRNGNHLATERWARAVQHLARAFWRETKIRFLQAHADDLPFLKGATAKDYNLHEHSDTTEDYLNTLTAHLPEGLVDARHQMQHYLARAQEQLNALKNTEEHHELLRAERIKAASEYGRAIENLSLAYGAEKAKKAA